MLGEQFESQTEAEHNFNPELFPYVNEIINSLTIMLFLPVCNHLLLPISPMAMSLKVRLFIGQCLNIIALGIVTYVQGTMAENPSVYVWWLFLPAIVLAVGETLTFIACKFSS